MSDVSTQQKDLQITIYANEIVRSGLESMLQRKKLADLCTFEIHNEASVILRHDGQETKFLLPVRIGALFDQILMLNKKAQRQDSVLLDLRYGILDTNIGRFTSSDKKAQRKGVLLTEKEVEILQYLHNNSGRKIARDELLEFVWGYAKNTETHTLETHIYRLRQKIELDSTSPIILKKDEEGYYLGKQ
jgi:DNA-binding response OmpR family regulator